MAGFHFKLQKLCVKSINNRIALSFSLLIATIIVFIVAAMGFLFAARFMDQKNILMQEKTTLLTQEVDKKIEIYRNLALSVKSDFVVSQYVNGDQNDFSVLESRLNYLCANTYGVQRMDIVNTEMKVLSSENSVSQGQVLLSVADMDKFIQIGREEWFSAPHNFPSPDKSNDYMRNSNLSYLSTIRNSDNFSVKGYLIINIRRNYLFPSMQSAAQSLFESTYVISKSGDVIYRLGEDNKTLEQESIKFACSGYFTTDRNTIGNYTYYKQTISSYPEWILVGVTSNVMLNKDITQLMSIIAMIGFLGIMTAVMLSRVISKKITQPIDLMKQAMTHFEQGEFPEKIVQTTHDELAYLINGFNHMLDDIEHFVDAIYHEQEEKKKAEVSALKFQLESLRSQINPHFLYNTLNTVSYLALKNGNEEIRALIQSLNLLLRSTLSDQNEFIPIRQEITFLEAYMNIQSYRYEESVQVIYKIDDAVLDCEIPKLILQPLVENAFLHGIYPKGGDGVITVKIVADESSVHVSVQDDGVGIDRETLKNIQSKPRGFNSIGISNVDERLKLYYGADAQLHYESEIGAGTVVHFTIPKPMRGDFDSCIVP
ncbi:sensor histidine kinase [Oscillospiraceae bacterium PP1C4]